MLLHIWPESFVKLVMTLEREQPSLYARVGVYLREAIEGSVSSATEAIAILNKELNVLVIPEMPVSEACDKYLDALSKMKAEVGSRANPAAITINTPAGQGAATFNHPLAGFVIPGNDTLN